MTKLIVAFRNFANAPKNEPIRRHQAGHLAQPEYICNNECYRTRCKQMRWTELTNGVTDKSG